MVELALKAFNLSRKVSEFKAAMRMRFAFTNNTLKPTFCSTVVRYSEFNHVQPTALLLLDNCPLVQSSNTGSFLNLYLLPKKSLTTVIQDMNFHSFG